MNTNESRNQTFMFFWMGNLAEDENHLGGGEVAEEGPEDLRSLAILRLALRLHCSFFLHVVTKVIFRNLGLRMDKSVQD